MALGDEALEIVRIIRPGFRCEHWPVEGNECVCQWMDRILAEYEGTGKGETVR